MSEPTAEDVLDFWIGPLDGDGLASDAHVGKWWTKDPAFDARIRARFEGLHGEIAAGRREAWRGDPRSTLAYVLVLDQLSRNMFRGQARAFDTDARALEVARAAIDRGDDRRLPHDGRSFLYLPLMHSEDPAVQAQCVALFTRLRDESTGRARERAQMSLDFAVKHQDVIARFNRFPGRNAALGRTSTPEEEAFLTQPGSAF